MRIRSILAVTALLGGEAALAADYTGNINMHEGWRTGEAAFTLASSLGTCTAGSSSTRPGTMRPSVFYAAVLSAETKGAPFV